MKIFNFLFFVFTIGLEQKLLDMQDNNIDNDFVLQATEILFFFERIENILNKENKIFLEHYLKEYDYLCN